MCQSKKYSDGKNGYFRFQACILPTTSLCVVHVWMCTQETLEGKMERETCHQKQKTETSAGENTSFDALTSSTPGIIPQMSGFLTSDRFWAATVLSTNTSYGINGHIRFQACILSTTSLSVVNVWLCTQETLESKRERETFNQK